jgi:exodeoxyribonuclease VII small subunit
MTNLTPQEKPPSLSFEEAFARMEHILEKLNSGAISLDESLKLYEEADRLIHECNKRLLDAERKIEILIKNRNGEAVLGPDQKPTTENFQLGPQNQA